MMWESYPNHNANDPEDFFEPFQTCDPHWSCDQLRILWKDDRIAATVRVFMREVYDGDNYLVMGGIGSVATHPDFRKQGLALLVLEDSIEFMKSLGVDYSSLYAGPIPLYEKLGFHVIPRITCSGKIRGSKRELVYSDDIERARDIYRDYHTGLSGTFKRSDAYWDTWVKNMRMHDGGVVYSSDLNTYVMFSVDQQSGDIIVMDAASVSAASNSLAVLLEEKLPGQNAMLWDIAPGHPIVSALQVSCEEFASDQARSFMVRQLSERYIPKIFSETIVDHF